VNKIIVYIYKLFNENVWVNILSKNIVLVFQKGQVETNKYRFLSKGGGYVWIVTQATILNDQKKQKPESIMCINYVVR